jgi:hypothetical protein
VRAALQSPAALRSPRNGADVKGGPSKSTATLAFSGITQASQARLAERGRLPNNGVLMPMREAGAEWTTKATAKQLPSTPHEETTQGDENRADRNAGLRCWMA